VSKTVPDELDSRRLRVLGHILRRARENLRFSYRELAARCGVSASHLLRMESGEFDFSVTKLMRVIEPLGLSPGVMLDTAMFQRTARVDISDEAIIQPVERALRAVKIAVAGTFQEQCEEAGYLVRVLVEVAASLIESSHPAQFARYILHPCEAVREQIERFGASRAEMVVSNKERAAALASLFGNPFDTLKRWGLLDTELLAAYLEWVRDKDDSQKLPRNTYTALLLGPAHANTAESAESEWMLEETMNVFARKGKKGGRKAKGNRA
jgi:transcriptional regulator with XRE-family HTH domain